MPNGKGSGRRPAAVDDAKVASEWERIFPTRRVGRYEDAVMHEVVVDHRLLRPAQPPPRPITTDLGSEFIRSIHDVARGPRGQ